MPRLWLLPLALACVTVANAHKASDAYLTIERNAGDVGARVDIALRDLDLAMGLDADGDGQITWGEVRRRHDAIASLVLASIELSVRSRACPLRVTGHRIDNHSDGAYAVIDMTAACERGDGALAVEYKLLFDVDPQHRAIVNVIDEGVSRSLVLSADHPRAEATEAGWLAQFATYVRDGALHIWTGYDHMLFLLGLLLPAVLVRRSGQWTPAERFGRVAWSVLGIVTAFTLAHAITLTLAAVGVLRIPSRVTESIIALSIIVAALLNFRDTSQRARWMIAFAFGLVHGLGFANVLTALDLPRPVLATALFAFNVGVEIGQLGVAAVFLPLAFMLRETRMYRPVVLAGGSLVIAVLGAAWFVERAFDHDLLRP